MLRNIVLGSIAAAGLGAAVIGGATAAKAEHWDGYGRSYYGYYGGPPPWRRHWGWRYRHHPYGYGYGYRGYGSGPYGRPYGYYGTSNGPPPGYPNIQVVPVIRY